MKLKMIAVLVLMLAVGLFSVQNATVITVRFVFWEFVVSQALVILLAAVFGALVGLMAGTLAARPAVPRESPQPAPLPPAAPSPPSYKDLE